MFRLSIKGDGRRQIERELTRISGRVKDFRPAWRGVIGALEDEMRARFDAEGAQGGESPWPPLSAAYAARKERVYGRQPILVQTGRMRESFQGGGDAIRDAGRMSLRYGTSVPYATFHQSGTSRMPPRPPLILSERGVREVVRVMQRHAFGARL